MTDTHKIELTPEQEAWLVKHFKHTKNDDVCKKLGIKSSTMHRIVRSLGLKKSNQFMKKTQQNASEIAWQNLTDEEKSRRTAQAMKNITEHRFIRTGISNVKFFGKKRWEEIKAKAHSTMNETRKKEYARIVYGLPQRTKYNLVRQSKNKLQARYRLVKFYGYKSQGKRDMIMPSDESMRNIKLEKVYTDRFHFNFIDA